MQWLFLPRIHFKVFFLRTIIKRQIWVICVRIVSFLNKDFHLYNIDFGWRRTINRKDYVKQNLGCSRSKCTYLWCNFFNAISGENYLNQSWSSFQSCENVLVWNDLSNACLQKIVVCIKSFLAMELVPVITCLGGQFGIICPSAFLKTL